MPDLRMFRHTGSVGRVLADVCRPDGSTVEAEVGETVDLDPENAERLVALERDDFEEVPVEEAERIRLERKKALADAAAAEADAVAEAVTPDPPVLPDLPVDDKPKGRKPKAADPLDPSSNLVDDTGQESAPTT